MSLYFSFPDRVFDYECARCTALCCRGQGVSMHAERELVPLLRRNPRLAAWAVGRNGKIVEFTSPTGRCYFLDAGDRCGIETELGRQLKPSLCRAFPFNRIRSLGETRLVSPHFLCPLDLHRDAAREPMGDHAALARELDDDGWLDQPFSALELHPSQTPAEFLRSEREFRDACAHALECGGALEELCDPGGASLGELGDVLGLAPTAGTPELERRVLALAPVWSIEQAKLPLAVRRRQLALARRMLGSAFSLPGTRTSLQSVYVFIEQRRALLDLLVVHDEPMPRGLLPAFGDGATMLAAALIDAAAGRGASVLEALREGCEGLASSDRLALVNSIAELYAKRCAPTSA